MCPLQSGSRGAGIIRLPGQQEESAMQAGSSRQLRPCLKKAGSPARPPGRRTRFHGKLLLYLETGECTVISLPPLEADESHSSATSGNTELEARVQTRLLSSSAEAIRTSYSSSTDDDGHYGFVRKGQPFVSEAASDEDDDPLPEGIDLTELLSDSQNRIKSQKMSSRLFASISGDNKANYRPVASPRAPAEESEDSSDNSGGGALCCEVFLTHLTEETDTVPPSRRVWVVLQESATLEVFDEEPWESDEPCASFSLLSVVNREQFLALFGTLGIPGGPQVCVSYEGGKVSPMKLLQFDSYEACLEFVSQLVPVLSRAASKPVATPEAQNEEEEQMAAGPQRRKNLRRITKSQIEELDKKAAEESEEDSLSRSDVAVPAWRSQQAPWDSFGSSSPRSSMDSADDSTESPRSPSTTKKWPSNVSTDLMADLHALDSPEAMRVQTASSWARGPLPLEIKEELMTGGLTKKKSTTPASTKVVVGSAKWKHSKPPPEILAMILSPGGPGDDATIDPVPLRPNARKRLRASGSATGSAMLNRMSARFTDVNRKMTDVNLKMPDVNLKMPDVKMPDVKMPDVTIKKPFTGKALKRAGTATLRAIGSKGDVRTTPGYSLFPPSPTLDALARHKAKPLPPPPPVRRKSMPAIMHAPFTEEVRSKPLPPPPGKSRPRSKTMSPRAASEEMLELAAKKALPLPPGSTKSSLPPVPTLSVQEPKAGHALGASLPAEVIRQAVMSRGRGGGGAGGRPPVRPRPKSCRLQPLPALPAETQPSPPRSSGPPPRRPRPKSVGYPLSALPLIAEAKEGERRQPPVPGGGQPPPRRPRPKSCRMAPLPALPTQPAASSPGPGVRGMRGRGRGRARPRPQSMRVGPLGIPPGGRGGGPGSGNGRGMFVRGRGGGLSPRLMQDGHASPAPVSSPRAPAVLPRDGRQVASTGSLVERKPLPPPPSSNTEQEKSPQVFEMPAKRRPAPTPWS